MSRAAVSAVAHVLVTGVLSGAALACAPAVARREAGTTPARETRAVRTVALDSTTAHRLCLAPDSVAAGRAECVLRDQRPPTRVF